MTWETPRTWVAGEIMTAAKMNTARDNLRWRYTMPSVRVINSTDLSIPNNVLTPLTFDTETNDNGSMHDTSSNPSYLTCIEAGVYFITGTAAWDTGSNRRVIAVKKNNTTFLAFHEHLSLSSKEITQTVNTQVYLDTGEYVELFAYHDAGSALDVKAFNHSPIFSMQFLSGGL